MRYDAEVNAAVGQAQRLYARAPNAALVHAVIQKETIHGALPTTGTIEPNGHMSYGLMQVQDSTAAQHGIQDPTTLVVPAIGIRIGTFELARLLSLYPGDTPRAIAAYNAGPGNSGRNAAGKFINQPYVDAVLSFWKQYGAQAVPAIGVLAAVALFLWFSSRRRATA